MADNPTWDWHPGHEVLRWSVEKLDNKTQYWTKVGPASVTLSDFDPTLGCSILLGMLYSGNAPFLVIFWTITLLKNIGSLERTLKTK